MFIIYFTFITYCNLVLNFVDCIGLSCGQLDFNPRALVLFCISSCSALFGLLLTISSSSGLRAFIRTLFGVSGMFAVRV